MLVNSALLSPVESPGNVQHLPMPRFHVVSLVWNVTWASGVLSLPSEGDIQQFGTSNPGSRYHSAEADIWLNFFAVLV